jgi:hypothetical protein
MTRTRLIVLLLSAVPLHAADRLMPGLWENTVTSNGQTATRTHCFTAAEAATANLPEKDMREATQKALATTGKGSCTLKDFKVEGNKITQLMTCGTASFRSVTVYHGDSSETTNTTIDGGSVKVALFKGRRLGVCK